jgi:hypothetical protein
MIAGHYAARADHAVIAAEMVVRPTSRTTRADL